LFDFAAFPTQLVDPIWEDEIEWKNVLKKGSIKKKLESLISDKKIDCAGHRIVHGGKKYKESVLIDSDVKKEIRKLADLAPLHNLADLEGIEILEQLFPDTPQVAVFDTAFHHTLPPYAAIYPGPYEWFEKGIQKFGFHGTSFQYCSRTARQFLGQDHPRMVICHLGSGASLCAVKNGKSIDTTMGLTPLEGLMMDTRSGTVDPGILLYLLKKKTVDELSKELYEKSGLLGLSGISSDMRDVLEKASQGNERAKLAIDVYIHRLALMIGSMTVSLGGMDALVFTAGIGENSLYIREQVCARLSFLGIHLSKHQINSAEDRELSSSDSKVKVLLIHTQEAFEIARECCQITQFF
jgi:acetate kinase